MSNVINMRKAAEYYQNDNLAKNVTETAAKPDLIDLLTSVDYDQENSLASQLVMKLKETDSPEELLEWFHSTKDSVSGEFFTGISIDDCRRFMTNKTNFVKYGDLIIRNATY